MSRLQYDHQGFLVGIQKSLDSQLKHQKTIKHDTATIIRLLQGELALKRRTLAKKGQLGNLANSSTSSIVTANAGNRSGNKPRQKPTRQTEQRQSHLVFAPPTPNSSAKNLRQNPKGTTASQGRDQNRDSAGRFIGKGNASQTKAAAQTEKQTQSLIVKAGAGVLDIISKRMAVDTQNLDPFLDAVSEVKDFVNPVTGAMGSVLGKNPKLPKPKERFYKKLHKKLNNILDKLNTPTKDRGGFGGLGKFGGKVGKGLMLAIGGVLAFALTGLFGNKKEPKPPKPAQTTAQKPHTKPHIGNAKQSLTPVTTNVDNTLNRVAKQEFGTLTNTLQRQDLPEKLLKLFAFGLSPFFVGASGIFDWLKTQAKDKLGIGGNTPTPPTGDNPTGGGGAGVGFGGNHSTFSNGAINITEQDIIRLAKVMQSEVGSSGFNEKWRADMGVAVLDTVLNRVVDSGFPNTIKEVINEKNQFSGINGPKTYKDKHGRVHKTGSPGDVDLYKQPSAEAVALVRQHLQYRANGGNRLVAGVNFLNPHTSGAKAMRSWGNKAMANAERDGTVYGRGNFIHYHAGKKVGDYGIRLQSGEQATQPKPILAPKTMVFGDGIASQYGKVHGIAHNHSKDGATPKQVYEQIQLALAKGQLTKGDRVILSTGLSSDINHDGEMLQQQMQLLQSSGIHFNVLGVANDFKDGSLGKGGNALLKVLTEQNGGNFLGGFNYDPKDKYKVRPTTDFLKSLSPTIGASGRRYVQINPSLPLPQNVPPPKPPVINQKAGATAGKDKTTVVAQSMIGQNVSDDRLAHAITGGIGQREIMT